MGPPAFERRASSSFSDWNEKERPGVKPCIDNNENEDKDTTFTKPSTIYQNKSETASESSDEVDWQASTRASGSDHDEVGILVELGVGYDADGREYDHYFPPLHRRKSSRIQSLDLLVPPPDSTLRKSGLFAATFNLVATIIGGGVLSIPLAFQQSGLVGGTVLMILAAVITDYSLYMLCCCARKTGDSSYGGVAFSAFGAGMKLCTVLSLFLYLWFVLVGFMVLVADIWTPIVMAAVSLASARDEQQDESGEEIKVRGEFARPLILAGILVFLSPLLLRRELHALRHTSFLVFISIFTLCVAMAYRAVERNVNNPKLFSTEIRYTPPAFGNTLFSFPIILLAFLSSFNVIGVHCELRNPSRTRVRTAIRRAIMLSFGMMYAFGLAGYLYGYNDTQGNILLNFNLSDKLIFVGFVGCGVTLLFAMPLSLLPCRDALMELPSQFAHWRRGSSAEVQSDQRVAIPVAVPEGEGTPLLLRQHVSNSDGPLLPTFQSREESLENPVSPTFGQNAMHIGATIVILTSCFTFAIAVPGVEVIWSIVGSSLAFFVQFILPATCYIKLCSKREGHYFSKRVVPAWMLLVFACFGACACTAHTMHELFWKAV